MIDQLMCAYRSFHRTSSTCWSAIIEWGRVEGLSKVYALFVPTSASCM